MTRGLFTLIPIGRRAQKLDHGSSEGAHTVERICKLDKVECTVTDKVKEDERNNTREMLLDTLRGLSSFKYQKECWVKHDKYPPGVEYDNLAYTLNYFYYDYPGLSESPHDLIGSTLDDLEEVEMVKKVVAALDVVFEDYFFDIPDIEIITLPEWQNVLEAAKEAYDFFRARMEKEYSQQGQKLPLIHYLDGWF